MKTKLIALLCLCAVMLFALTETADIATPEHAQEKIRVDRTVDPYQVPADYLDFSEGIVLLYEDFEAGMPAGWTVVDGNLDGVTWTTGTTYIGGYDPPAYGTAYAYYSDDLAGSGAPPGTEYLTAPAVGCAGYGNLEFSYGWGFYIYDPPYGEVWARFHNGTSWGAWNSLATYYVNANGIAFFTLGAYLPADSVQVRFTYEDPTGGWGWAFGIDNVLLEVPPAHDVGCTAVTSPPEGSITPGYYNVIGAIENFGLNNEIFDVTAKVYDTDGMVELFSATQLCSLVSGATTSIDFGSMDFVADKYFLTEIYTDLAGDEVPGNDLASVESRTALGLGDVIFEMDAQTPTGDVRLLGVEFDGEYFYCTGAGDYTQTWVHVIDTLGNLVWSMYQTDWSTGWGWRDLAWDKSYRSATRIDTLYASVNAYVDKFGIDLTTGTLTYYSSFPGMQSPNRALAYKGDMDWFYTASFSSNCHKFTRYGVWLQSVMNTYAIYGAAYDTDAAEGGWVWWHSQDDPGTGYGLQLSQMDANTMAWTGVTTGYVPTGLTSGIAGGCCFYEGFRGYDVLFCMVQGDPVDKIVGVIVRPDVPAIAATVDINPDHLNLKARGKPVTCYIELEEGYDVEDIDLATVAITEIDGIAIDPIYAADKPWAIGDYDDDGIPDLKVKFSRWELFEAFRDVGAMGFTDVTVFGEVTGMGEFEGVAMVMLLHEASGGSMGRTGIPRCFALYENQPNPFNSSTVISYALPEQANVELHIYDASGRLVKTLVNASMTPGYHNVRWDARDNAGHEVASGVYFMKFEAGSYRHNSKLLLVR